MNAPQGNRMKRDHRTGAQPVNLAAIEESLRFREFGVATDLSLLCARVRYLEHARAEGDAEIHRLRTENNGLRAELARAKGGAT